MMLPRRSFALILAVAAGLPLAASRPALAIDVFWIPTGTSNYSTTTNWENTPGGGNGGRGLPEAPFEEVAVIINGGTAEVASAVPVNPGGVSLGLAPVGTQTGTGTLRIVAGGSLTAELAGSANGVITVGGGTGTGTFNMTGGTLTAVGLNSGGAAASAINLSGNAVLNLASSTLGRNTRITGPNVNFNSTGNVTLQGAGTYTAEITAATHSPIKSTTGITLAGNLNIQFTGITPSAGQSWNLADSPGISGAFANAPIGADLTVNGAPAPPIGSAYRLSNVAGGSGRQLRLSLDRVLVMRVNRDTGELSIRNPQGAAVNSLTGYTVTSPVGGSLVAGYKGISGAPAGDTGWEKVPGNSATGLAELKPAGVLNVSSNATNVSLGNGFSRTAVAAKGLGVSGEDLTFTYTSFGGSVVRGQIEYVGTPFLNNLALIVNATTGQASLKNDSTVNIAIDGYSILSSTGALTSTGWNSLTDQAATYPNWQESPATANAMSETNPVGPLSLTAGQTIALGSIGDFTSDAAKNGLTMKFIIGSEVSFRQGAVSFTTGGGGLAGDYNGSGRVDGNDFLVWQRALTTNAVPPGSGADGDASGSVGAGDLTVWRNNFGAGSTVAAAAVPEPSSWMLAALAASCVAVRRGRVAVRPAIV